MLATVQKTLYLSFFPHFRLNVHLAPRHPRTGSERPALAVKFPIILRFTGEDRELLNCLDCNYTGANENETTVDPVRTSWSRKHYRTRAPNPTRTSRNALENKTRHRPHSQKTHGPHPTRNSMTSQIPCPTRSTRETLYCGRLSCDEEISSDELNPQRS